MKHNDGCTNNQNYRRKQRREDMNFGCYDSLRDGHELDLHLSAKTNLISSLEQRLSGVAGKRLSKRDQRLVEARKSPDKRRDDLFLEAMNGGGSSPSGPAVENTTTNNKQKHQPDGNGPSLTMGDIFGGGSNKRSAPPYSSRETSPGDVPRPPPEQHVATYVLEASPLASMRHLSLRGTRLFSCAHNSIWGTFSALTRLRELDLADTHLGSIASDQDGVGITDMITTHLKDLTTLSLASNFLHEDLHEFALALRENRFRKLKELNLSFTTCVDVDNKGVAFLIECLRSNTTVQTLDLASCGLSAQTMVILEQTLMSETAHLIDVKIPNNPIGTEGVESMCRCLVLAEPQVEMEDGGFCSLKVVRIANSSPPSKVCPIPSHRVRVFTVKSSPPPRNVGGPLSMRRKQDKLFAMRKNLTPRMGVGYFRGRAIIRNP